MFSRLYVPLRLVRCKTGVTTNFIFQDVPKSTGLLNYSSGSAFKEFVPNDVSKERHLEDIKLLEKTGYVGRLEGDKLAKESTNVNTQDIEILKKSDCKFRDALEDIDVQLPGPLDPCTEDLSHIGPDITPTFNYAKFADQSTTIQELVKLGVELYKLEINQDVMKMFLSLDFEKDMKPYIQFLTDCGVQPERLGYFITRNPNIFKENMDDLYTRIRYLRAHNFKPDMIEQIVSAHPPWLSFPTTEIDARLGYFQHTFSLNGAKVRFLTVLCPKLITYSMYKIKCSTFSIKEEMGFDKHEIQTILLKAPRVWIRARKEVMKTFSYLHDQMQLPRSAICREPQILVCRKHRLESRHRYLVHLKRDQFDSTKPLYVSPFTIVRGSDADFCENIAKTSIDMYNTFLKTL